MCNISKFIVWNNILMNMVNCVRGGGGLSQVVTLPQCWLRRQFLIYSPSMMYGTSRLYTIDILISRVLAISSYSNFTLTIFILGQFQYKNHKVEITVTRRLQAVLWLWDSQWFTLISPIWYKYVVCQHKCAACWQNLKNNDLY